MNQKVRKINKKVLSIITISLGCRLARNSTRNKKKIDNKIVIVSKILESASHVDKLDYCLQIYCTIQCFFFTKDDLTVLFKFVYDSAEMGQQSIVGNLIIRIPFEWSF